MGEGTTIGRVQYGALPFALDASGLPRVMLVTSRGGRRWVIPKGSPIRRLSAPEVAAREAYEEAGLIGQVIGRRAVGEYSYIKRGGPKQVYTVIVFLMQVERQLDAWPERRDRRTAWFDLPSAIKLIDIDGLSVILQQLSENFGRVLDDVLTGPETVFTRPRLRRPRKAIAKLTLLATTRFGWS